MKFVFLAQLLLASCAAENAPLTTGTLLSRPWGSEAAEQAPAAAHAVAAPTEGEKRSHDAKPTPAASATRLAVGTPVSAAQTAARAAAAQKERERQAALRSQWQAGMTAYHQQEAVHKDLLARSQSGKTQVEVALKKLEEVRRQLGLEATRQRKLSQLLGATENYSAQCKVWLGALQKSQHDEHSPGRRAASKRSGGGEAGALVADSGELVNKMGKAEGEEALLVQKLRKDTSELESLGPRYAAENKHLQQLLAKERAASERESKAMEGNMRQIDRLQAKKDALLKEAEELKQQLSPVALATIQAENEAYRAELQQALAQLRDQGQREARAAAAASKAEAEADMEKQAAANASSAVQMTAKEGRVQLQQAVAQARVHEHNGESVFAQVKEALGTKCKDEHASRNLQMRHELARCAALDQQLAVTRARTDATSQALKAQQAALYVNN